MSLLSTLGLACSVVGIRTAKEPGYRVVHADGDMEIREYDTYIVARTEVRGDYGQSGRDGFRLLFDYISGNNAKNLKISVTAPVLQEEEGTKIAMTAPVVQEQVGEVWQMDFVMPADFVREEVPTPRDGRVKIFEVPPRTVAVLRYSGLVSGDDIVAKTHELEAWLAGQSYRGVSAARSARYDPPFTLPFLRRNEVHVTVVPSDDD